MHPVLMQASYYGIVMFLTLFIISVLQKGFFLRYIKVRLSFGRLVMVKVRTVHRDYFRVGWIEENFLKFKDKKSNKSYTCNLKVKGTDVFYRALSVLWVDYNEKTKEFVKHDFTTVSAYDPVAFDELLQRALKGPLEIDNLVRIILIASCLSALAGAITIYLIWYQGPYFNQILAKCGEILTNLANIPKPAPI